VSCQRLSILLVVLACLQANVSDSWAQYRSPEVDTMEKSTAVLRDFVTMPNQNIPQSMLHKAHGLVIVPGMLKLGLGVSGRHGRGVVVVRDENGQWRPPTFLTISGGGLGLQVGVQSIDVVLVFNTRNSVDNLLRGKLTIGGDVSAAVGPVGRAASAATDARLQAEVYSYSRARGLFAGVEVNGMVIQLDAARTQSFYQAAGVAANGTPVAPNDQLPLSAAQFLSALATYSGSGAATAVAEPANGPVQPLGNAANASGIRAPGSTTPAQTSNPMSGNFATGSASGGPVLVPGNAAGTAVPGARRSSAGTDRSTPTQRPTSSLEATRLELARAAQSLGRLLDESWRRYLSLPSSVFDGQTTPTSESLKSSLGRFDAVAQDSQYELLQRQAQFRETHGLLRSYLQQVEAAAAANGLPGAGLPSPPDTPSAGARGSLR
jgi:lipid-binding SYLF domain-containing protein